MQGISCLAQARTKRAFDGHGLLGTDGHLDGSTSRYNATGRRWNRWRMSDRGLSCAGCSAAYAMLSQR